MMRAIFICALIASLPAQARNLTVPDRKLTPGAVTDLTVEQICATKWGKDARAVTAKMKREVFARYGLKGNSDKACKADRHGRHCEIDHLISRELGGADELENLWPQPYGTKPWNATLKDRVENRLHKEICAGNLSLQHAWDYIRYYWPDAYLKYFGAPK